MHRYENRASPSFPKKVAEIKTSPVPGMQKDLTSMPSLSSPRLASAGLSTLGPLRGPTGLPKLRRAGPSTSLDKRINCRAHYIGFLWDRGKQGATKA